MDPNALLQQQSIDRDKQNYLNTNFLNSKEPGMIIAQDLVTQYALSNAVEACTIDLLTDALRNGLIDGKTISVPIKNSTKSLKLAPQAIDKTIKTVTQASKNKATTLAKNVAHFPKQLKAMVAASKAAKSAATIASKAPTKISAVRSAVNTGKAVGKAASKAAVKAVVKVGQSASRALAMAAAKGAMVMATICAASGAQTAGVGCLVALAIEVMMLAFDAFNIAMDIIDPNGLSIVINKKDIELVANHTRDWILQNRPDASENAYYFDEEVLFDYESFKWEYDEEGNIYANEYWASQYEKYRDEYMAGIGITGDWRSRLESVNVPDVNDPGVLSPLTIVFREAKDIIQQDIAVKKKKDESSSLLLIVGITFFIIFLVIIIFFFIIEGDDE
jgi:hypothetical protein